MVIRRQSEAVMEINEKVLLCIVRELLALLDECNMDAVACVGCGATGGAECKEECPLSIARKAIDADAMAHRVWED